METLCVIVGQYNNKSDVYISLSMYCVPVAFTKSGTELKPFPCSELNSWCLAEPSLEAHVSDLEPSQLISTTL